MFTAFNSVSKHILAWYRSFKDTQRKLPKNANLEDYRQFQQMICFVTSIGTFIPNWKAACQVLLEKKNFDQK